MFKFMLFSDSVRSWLHV